MAQNERMKRARKELGLSQEGTTLDALFWEEETP